jgi:hypothetical protein
LGRFYASLENGHTTASAALKQLHALMYYGRRGRFAGEGLDVVLPEHVCTIEWGDVILFGRYVLVRAQVR